MGRLGAIALAAVALSMPAQAQMGMAENSGAGMHFAGPARGVTIGIARTAQAPIPFSHPFQPIFLGAPLFADYEPVAAPPQVLPVIVVQAVVQPQPVADTTREEIKPAEPLLIEWQGDHYVRFSGTDIRGFEAQSAYAKASAVHASQPPELPPAVLVFRDGHREAVRDYAIVQNVIYARGNYWSDGYWTKAIFISKLDVPATMRANDELGIPFTLPAGPNEVVTRP